MSPLLLSRYVLVSSHNDTKQKPSKQKRNHRICTHAQRAIQPTFNQTDHIIPNQSTTVPNLSSSVDFHDLADSALVEGRMYVKSVFPLFLINQRALEAGNDGNDLADLGLGSMDHTA